MFLYYLNNFHIIYSNLNIHSEPETKTDSQQICNFSAKEEFVNLKNPVFKL